MIQVEKLTKNFHEFQVLDNINLQVKQGTIFGLVGPNGAGKTTLIKIIMGILMPDQGRVLIEKREMISSVTLLSLSAKTAS